LTRTLRAACALRLHEETVLAQVDADKRSVRHDLGICKRGNSPLVQGARAVMRYAEQRTDALGRWLQALLRRRHSNVVACALANKMARIVWAILAEGGEYRAQPVSLDNFPACFCDH